MTRLSGRRSHEPGKHLSNSLDEQTLARIRALESEAPGLLAKVMLAFLDDAPHRVDALRSALESENMDQVRKAAHGLKGACANVGATRAAHICSQIEKCAAEGAGKAAGTAFQGLEKELGNVRRDAQALAGPT